MFFTHKPPISYVIFHHFYHPHSLSSCPYTGNFSHFTKKPFNEKMMYFDTAECGRWQLFKCQQDILKWHIFWWHLVWHTEILATWNIKLPHEWKEKLFSTSKHFSMNEDGAVITLRVTADVVLAGRQAMSVFTPLGVRNSFTAGRLFVLLLTWKRQKDRWAQTCGQVVFALKHKGTSRIVAGGEKVTPPHVL